MNGANLTQFILNHKYLKNIQLSKGKDLNQ